MELDKFRKKVLVLRCRYETAKSMEKIVNMIQQAAREASCKECDMYTCEDCPAYMREMDQCFFGKLNHTISKCLEEYNDRNDV